MRDVEGTHCLRSIYRGYERLILRWERHGDHELGVDPQ